MTSEAEFADRFLLTDQVAIITGAGKGIGAAIATTFAAAGADVVLTARTEEDLEAVAAEVRALGRRALVLPGNVNDLSELANIVDRTVAEFGRLDIVVNNAGGSAVQAPLLQLDPDEWDATLRLNLTSVWTCTRAAAARMRDGGRIVNISSLAATTTTPGSGHYSAAKAGVNSLTRTFARELGPRLRVNCVMPGAVPTEIMMTALRLDEADLLVLEKRLRLPMRRLGTTDDLGRAVLFLVAPASSWVTGQVIAVDGGLSA
jgi:NAD(P)-dependent dehydrogenase (short-subunit alcohol dehydrogenase family)